MTRARDPAPDLVELMVTRLPAVLVWLGAEAATDSVAPRAGAYQRITATLIVAHVIAAPNSARRSSSRCNWRSRPPTIVWIKYISTGFPNDRCTGPPAGRSRRLTAPDGARAPRRDEYRINRRSSARPQEPEIMANLIKEHRPIIQLGAGALFIDRYTDNGNIRGAEMYIGDTVAASISATVERTTVYSGDGAVASKLIDRVRRIDRAMSITVQDATLGRDALFMMADRPGREEAGNPDEELITVIRVPEHVSDRTHFQLGSGEMGTTPAGRPKFDPRRMRRLARRERFHAAHADCHRAALTISRPFSIQAVQAADYQSGRKKFRPHPVHEKRHCKGQGQTGPDHHRGR